MFLSRLKKYTASAGLSASPKRTYAVQSGVGPRSRSLSPLPMAERADAADNHALDNNRNNLNAEAEAEANYVDTDEPELKRLASESSSRSSRASFTTAASRPPPNSPTASSSSSSPCSSSTPDTQVYVRSESLASDEQVEELKKGIDDLLLRCSPKTGRMRPLRTAEEVVGFRRFVGNTTPELEDLKWSRYNRRVGSSVARRIRVATANVFRRSRGKFTVNEGIADSAASPGQRLRSTLSRSTKSLLDIGSCGGGELKLKSVNTNPNPE